MEEKARIETQGLLIMMKFVCRFMLFIHLNYKLDESRWSLLINLPRQTHEGPGCFCLLIVKPVLKYSNRPVKQGLESWIADPKK